MRTTMIRLRCRQAVVAVLCTLISALSVFSAERLFCGFEQAELATWPLTSSDAGDGDLKYIGSSSDQPYVSWLTSESASDVMQGTRALCHEIWPINPVSTKLVRFQASLWQDWSWHTNTGYGGGAGAWDSTRTRYGEYFGNVEWNARRMCPLVSLMGTVDRLPDSLRDWSGFDCLYIDVKSSAARIALWVYLFGKDRPSHRRTFIIDPGNYVTLRVPIKEMAWTGGLDVTSIKNLRIELCDAKGPTRIFIDNIRLATADVTPSLTVVNDSTPVVPWLLTSPHQPPRNQAVPVVDVPVRVTGEIIASAPVIVASTPTGANTDRSSGNLGNAISVFDNNRISLIGEMSGYVSWQTSPYMNRSWIVSTDGGATWHSDGSRTQPRVFSTTHRGSLNCWGQGDLQMRGTDYVMPMGWCGSYSPGSGHMLYHEFYKVVPTNAGWQAYPMMDYTAVPQRWSAIITMDQVSGCQGGVKLASLPSGRLFMITADWNPKAILGWALMSSYSDDGGIRWQFPQGRSAVYTPASSDPYNIYVNSSPSYLLPYKHNQVMTFYGQSGILYSSIYNGTSWEKFSSFMPVGYVRSISNGVTYMDSTVFLCMKLTSAYTGGPGLSLVKRTGSVSATEQVVTLSPNLKYGKLTLCGERLWFTWVDTLENAIYAKKYFIRSNTWSDSVKLVQAGGRLRGTIISTVAPPAFVPIAWYEQDVSDVKIKFLRVPIDATEKAMDTDFDGLDDAVEAQYGCVVGNPDTDGDGLWDGQEVVLLGTDPNNTDSDNDGDNDAEELYHYTDPINVASNISGNTAPLVDVVPTVTNWDVRLDASGTIDAQSDFLRYFWDVRDADGKDHYVEGSRVSLTTGLQGYRLTVDDGRGKQSVVEYGVLPDSTWIPSVSKENARILHPYHCELTINPNPASGPCVVHYMLPEKSRITLSVFDLRGRQVKQLISGQETPAGRYLFTWNRNDYVPGVYFFRFESGNVKITKKIILLQ